MDLGVLRARITPELLLILIPLAWLLWRLKQVFDIPVDDLVRILGMEVPAAPLVSLLEITSAGAKVRWQTTDQRNGGLRFLVRINGDQVGEVGHQETAIAISGLRPASHYIIRIVAINQSNYTAASDAIRIRTIAEGPADTSNGNARSKSENALQLGSSATPSAMTNAVIAPFRPAAENTASHTTHPMTRDNSSANTTTRRNTGSRVTSVSQTAAKSSVAQDENEKDTIEKLNKKLEKVREQLREQESLDAQEDAEFEAAQTEMVGERDELRRRARERDEHNKELNKTVKGLEHSQSSAERRRQHVQKLLDDKRREREKMLEDMARWDRELSRIVAENEALEQMKLDIEAETGIRVEEIRAQQRPDLEALAMIEEQIQDKGKVVAELDSEKKRLGFDAEQAEAPSSVHALEVENTALDVELLNLQAQLSEAYATLYQARTTYDQLCQQLDLLAHTRRESMHNGYSTHYQPTPAHDTDESVVESTYLPPMNRVNFDLPEARPSQTSHANRGEPVSTRMRTASPFVTPATLVTPVRYPHANGLGGLDLDQLTGGALISPSADGLIPSDLLGEDDLNEMIKPRLRAQSTQHSGESSPRPPSAPAYGIPSSYGITNVLQSSGDGQYGQPTSTLPGLGGPDSTPNSPAVSFTSNTPSLLSSPHTGFAFPRQHKRSDPNLGQIGAGRFDSDRRSVRSASGSANNSLPSRGFLNFGISRQRGKTTSEDGPQLGSLKPSQSQSVPREAADANPPFSGRGLLRQLMGPRFSSSREPENPFTSTGAALGPIGPPSSSRPASTYSADSSTFPKPSTYSSRFGWGASKENLGRAGSVHSAAIWTDSPWESRRPSVQEGFAGSSLRDTTDFEADDIEEGQSEDNDDSHEVDRKSTRTKDSLATQLNPAARDFTSVFGFGKKGDKSSSTRSKKREPASTDDLFGSELTEESSPANSRKSRDTRPSSVGESFEDLADDAEQLHSASAESQTQPSPGSKGSLMRRITRKGSAGKFGLSSLKEKKEKGGGLFSRKAAAAATNVPEEATAAAAAEEDPASAALGRSIDSLAAAGTPDKRSSAFSLASLRGRKSRKPAETQSVSEVSMSETGDDDDEGAAT